MGEERTFRLDRITQATTRPGTFTPPAGLQDPAQDLLTRLATAPHRHHVILHIHGTAAQIHTRLPPGFALVTEPPRRTAGPASSSTPTTSTGCLPSWPHSTCPSPSSSPPSSATSSSRSPTASPGRPCGKTTGRPG
ncbi:WYL domain-containing protein [Nonomuraea salmonea]|uniref:WYL domain-containing protein n=1 Tax=Nonomuraea salmonea TaxID=46181 RepID=UPI003CD0C341